MRRQNARLAGWSGALTRASLRVQGPVYSAPPPRRVADDAAPRRVAGGFDWLQLDAEEPRAWQ
jgi:hypothetical protein